MSPRLIAFSVVILALFALPVYLLLSARDIVELPDGYLKVDLKAMSTFPFDQVRGTINDIPERWRRLDGAKVVLEGEMWTDNRLGPTHEFDLVYSIQQCCFSGEPQIQHFVKSTTVDGRPVEVLRGIVRVRGTLRVNVIHDPLADRVRSVYQLEVEEIRRVG